MAGEVQDTVGSLILGLYEGGGLRPVGHCAGFTAARKRALRAELAPYETGGRGSADPSRWGDERELEWVELRPELVAEVSYDHASGGRIRHGARLLRFRDDREPASCTPISSRRERRPTTRPSGRTSSWRRPAPWPPWPGLLFVAVSINVERILAYKGLPERALEALLALIGALVASILALAPVQTTTLGWLLLKSGIP